MMVESQEDGILRDGKGNFQMDMRGESSGSH